MQPDSPREKLAAFLEMYSFRGDSGIVDGIDSRDTLTYGDLRALLAEPAPPVAPSDALRQVEALLDAMETCHICRATLLVDDGPTYCAEGGCSYDCECHKGPECTPISTLHQQARRALSALAQQLQEGERHIKEQDARIVNQRADLTKRQAEIVDHLRTMSAYNTLLVQANSELDRAKSALVVAEKALNHRSCYFCSVGSEANSKCSSCSMAILALARIAALKGAPTGTPGAEKGSPE